MNLQIEKNVPMPINYGNSSTLTTTIAKMEVGDSVFVPDVRQPRLASSISYTGKKTGRKFTYRTVEGGFRVWRAA